MPDSHHSRRSRPFADATTIAALVVEWTIVAATMAAALTLATWWAYGVAAVVIATRQHALLMLFHDAVHGLWARSVQVNDLLTNLLVGVPHVLPLETYRALHLAHHRNLGSAADPERRFLYADQPWQYRPLKAPALARQLLGDVLVVNGARTLAAWRRAGGSIKAQPSTWLIAAIWLCGIAVCAWNAAAATATIALLWFVPLLTLTNLLQKLRSFAEHSGGPGVTPGWDNWTYSWQPGLLGRLTIWPYHINLHREHHARPAVPWHQLPALQAEPRLAGSNLPYLLHRS